VGGGARRALGPCAVGRAGGEWRVRACGSRDRGVVASRRSAVAETTSAAVGVRAAYATSTHAASACARDGKAVGQRRRPPDRHRLAGLQRPGEACRVPRPGPGAGNVLEGNNREGGLQEQGNPGFPLQKSSAAAKLLFPIFRKT